MTKKDLSNEERFAAKWQVTEEEDLQETEERDLNAGRRLKEPKRLENKKKRSTRVAIVAGIIVAVAVFVVLGFQNRQMQDVDLGSTAIQEFITEYAGQLESIAQPMLERMGAGSSVAVEPGVGNELVYVLRYGSEIATEGLAAESEEDLNTFTPKLEGLAHEIQHILYVNDLSITVNYLSYEGNLLATRRFGGLHGH